MVIVRRRNCGIFLHTIPGMDKISLIELLTKERDFHAAHPHQVNTKFMYGLGTSLASVVAGIYFSGTEKSELDELFARVSMFIVLFLFVLGLIIVIIGLAEHANLHKQQRRRIEAAIQDILAKGEKFKYDEFWQEYQSHRLKYFNRRVLKIPTPLFAVEPDTRGFWSFHDRKIELGALIMVIAYGILIYQAFF